MFNDIIKIKNKWKKIIININFWRKNNILYWKL